MELEPLQLELEVFQGPFDLLLHLIREMKININDIPMQEVTSQYLLHIDEMVDLQLDQIGDYLVMAATLIEIKSSLLLPTETQLDLEDEFPAEDPREGLVQQLLLYQQFQQVADKLQTQADKQSLHYSKPAQDLSKYQAVIPLQEGELSLHELGLVMEDLLVKVKARQPLERQMEVERITVEDKIHELLTLLKETTQSVNFDKLIINHSKIEIITSFMAVLELVHRKIIIFRQESDRHPLIIERTTKEFKVD